MLTAIVIGVIGGIGISVIYRAEREHKERLSAARQTQNETQPRELPFRTMGEVDAANGAVAPVGPLRSCPRCGEKMRTCTTCHRGGTQFHVGEAHRDSTGYCGRYDTEGYSLNFTHGTDAQRLCSPERRVRYGFLWLTACEEPGIHVHQKCERCAWSGIARIEPPDDELGPLR